MPLVAVRVIVVSVGVPEMVQMPALAPDAMVIVPLAKPSLDQLRPSPRVIVASTAGVMPAAGAPAVKVMLAMTCVAWMSLVMLPPLANVSVLPLDPLIE